MIIVCVGYCNAMLCQKGSSTMPKHTGSEEQISISVWALHSQTTPTSSSAVVIHNLQFICVPVQQHNKQVIMHTQTHIIHNNNNELIDAIAQLKFHSIVFTISDAPAIQIIGTPHMDLEEGKDSLVLRCIADANPPASIVWRRAGRSEIASLQVRIMLFSI